MAIVDDERPLFILAGNGPYDNRGCEAIVRGTTEILRRRYKNPKFICLSHFHNRKQYLQQQKNEKDVDILHIQSYPLNKKELLFNFWNPYYLRYFFEYITKSEKFKNSAYKNLIPYLKDATAVLAIGGDNYSIDYGLLPKIHTDLDDIVIENRKPILLWGASIGPFDAMPKYEEYMSMHLRKVTGIFSRESMTTDYLQKIGVSNNVYSVADPAFLMEPVKPRNIDDSFEFEHDAIGLNISPLMGRFVTSGNLEKWELLSSKIIIEIAKTTELPIYLIPHVSTPYSDDYRFMEKILRKKVKKTPISLIPPIYNAAETKWIISQMSIFAGSRTHATIAALSSNVVTLSLAYSIKARGINFDIFNHENFVLNPDQISPDRLVKKIDLLIDQKTDIQRLLYKKIPSIKDKSEKAGEYLFGMLSN